MAKPRNWDGLSAAYRKRLEGAGVTRSAYESGIPLAKARGHAGPRGEGKRPKGVGPNRRYLDKLIENLATDKERRSVETWYKERSPRWLRSRDLGADVAGQIYYANLRPEYWASVDVFIQRDGSVMVYIESTRGGPTRSFPLSDVDSARDLERWYVSRQAEPVDVTWHGTPNARSYE